MLGATSSNVHNFADSHEGRSFSPLTLVRSRQDQCIQSRDEWHGSDSDEEASDNESEQNASPFQCLFCNRVFEVDDVGLTANLEHMRSTHNMSIPDPDTLIDMQSFVEYLATEVRTWHECLYCGATKSSTLGVQSHMRDKGHCLLNFDREPELLDFWDNPRMERDRPTTLSATEIRFASGKVVGSRGAVPAESKLSKKRSFAVSATMALRTRSKHSGSSVSGQQLARRDMMSIAGVSVQQRQALVLAEKKAQRSEAVARRAREWMYAKGANSQKFDQVDNQMKWGKQNHKLQPR